MKLALPASYNAATTFVDDNIKHGRGNRIAIHYQDQQVTYQDLFRRVNQTGNAIKELGVSAGDRVLLALPDSPAFAYGFFGAIKVGAVPIP
nr:AMP-binding protein [Deltaproteobacteria bacterium]